MFEYTFMQNAFIVSLLISLLCPLIGIFLVLRRYSMIGGCVEPCFPCRGSHGPSFKIHTHHGSLLDDLIFWPFD